MSSNTETGRASLSTTRAHLGLALPPAGEIDAAPHLVTVALAHAAIAATHCALTAAHPVLASSARPGGALRELTDAEHFAALILHVSGQLAEMLDEYAASYDVEHDDDATANASALR